MTGPALSTLNTSVHRDQATFPGSLNDPWKGITTPLIRFFEAVTVSHFLFEQAKLVAGPPAPFHSLEKRMWPRHKQ
jgi:hypothetical protein